MQKQFTKTMKKSKVFLGVAAVVALAGAGIQGAQAHSSGGDEILFPYFSSGGGDLTFVKIINDRNLDELHYTYVYNSGAEVCQHYDVTGDTSNNDILMYEVTDSTPGLPGQLLPGDTTSVSPPLTVNPAWGYLVVNQRGSSNSSAEGTLRGQAYVINVNTGTAYAYNAINDPDYNDNTRFYENADDEHYLSWLPEVFASTVYYFFPVDGSDLDDNLVVNSEARIGYWEGGLYNNNETRHSGVKYLPVGCQSARDIENDPIGPILSADFFYSLPQIMSGAQYNVVRVTGGWTDMEWLDYGYPYKLQTSGVLGSPVTTLLYEPGMNDDYRSYTK